MTIGSVMVDIQGAELTRDDEEFLKNPMIGGLIFFTRNYRSPAPIH